MNTWFSYFNDEGALCQYWYCGDKKFAQDNAPKGTKPIEGKFDPGSQKVDIETGEVVDYIPPAPSIEHEWRGKQWVKRAEVVAAESERAKARAQIANLERQQARRVRELLMQNDVGLQTIDAQITELRRKL